MIRPIDQESVQSNEAARKGKQLSGTPLTAALSAARALRPAWSVGCVALQDSGALGQLFCSVLKFGPSRHPPYTPSLVTRGALRFVTSSVGVARWSVLSVRQSKALFSTPFPSPCTANAAKKNLHTTLPFCPFLLPEGNLLRVSRHATRVESRRDTRGARVYMYGIGKVPKLHTDCRAVAHFPARSRPGSYKAIPSVG